MIVRPAALVLLLLLSAAEAGRLAGIFGQGEMSINQLMNVEPPWPLPSHSSHSEFEPSKQRHFIRAKAPRT